LFCNIRQIIILIRFSGDYTLLRWYEIMSDRETVKAIERAARDVREGGPNDIQRVIDYTEDLLDDFGD
jgi:hypothetical protein